MPWISVVKGKYFYIKTDVPYEVESMINGDTSFQKLEAEVKQAGLYLIHIANEEKGVLAIQLGKELYPKRHIYQGLSFSVDDHVSPEEKSLTDSLSDRLFDVLADLSYECEVKDGLAIGQFD